MLAARKIRLVMELRRLGVVDPALLAAVERVPREAFVPEAFVDQAYVDSALPIGHGQTISQPSVVARMVQALEVTREHKVLEIGMGSGYLSAILSHLCRRVYAIERHAPLREAAEARLQSLRRFNIVSKRGDGLLGWPEQAPFDRIVSSAAAVDIPPILASQLAESGVFVLPLGDPHLEQRLHRFRKIDGDLVGEDLGPVRFLPLVGGLPGRREAI